MKKLIYLSVLFGSIANAGWWVEPQLGYNQNTHKVVTVSGTDNSSKGSGLHMGVMGGYLINNMWAVGVGATSDSHKAAYDAASSLEFDYAHSSFDVVLGYMQPKGFRFYVNTAVSAKTTHTFTGGSSVDYSSGTKYGAGIGYQFHDHIAVNVDYISYKPTKLTISSIEADVSGSYSTFETTGIGVNVSFPFNFGK